jgi:hypothetical protein
MLGQVNGPYFFVSCDTDFKCFVGATTSSRAEGEELVWILTKESCTLYPYYVISNDDLRLTAQTMSNVGIPV